MRKTTAVAIAALLVGTAASACGGSGSSSATEGMIATTTTPTSLPVAKVPYGRFEHGVQTRNFSPIEPDVIEEKIYAQGVGVVLEITVSGGSDRDELLSYHEG